MEAVSLQKKRQDISNNVEKVHEKSREWNLSKKWNPFNSYKLLSHVDRWRRIKRGRPIPPPVLVTVDPTNVCNFDCVWCNAEFIRKKRKGSLSEKMLAGLADFLPRWGTANSGFKPGVESVCVAGGGEPLLNPATAVFIDRLISNGIEVGIVTNGSQLIENIDALSQCTWVGVSMDAGRSKTFDKLKGVSSNKTYFDRIIEGIAVLSDYARRQHTRLGLKHPAYGVSYKYLLYKDNIGEVYQATKQAKEIGCKNIHFRPAGTTWDKIETENQITFTPDEIALFKEQITKAMELDDETFGVYGVTHKFNSQFEPSNYFEKCYSIFMTAVFMPPNGKDIPEDAFIFGLCCDRRGDEKLELATDIEDVEKIDQVWGGKRHWKMHDSITVADECPRCTYQPHNEIYEQVILNDSMTYKFI